MAKSLCVSYFLWLVGGFFGLHHLYLRRDKQAFVWWALPGGYFGCGWIRDLWRMPEYVRDANDDVDYIKELTERMRLRPRPPFTLARAGGQLLVGNLFGVLSQICVPGADDLGGIDLSPALKFVAPAAVALGIWLVGNIGREQGSIVPSLLCCYATLPYALLSGAHNVTLASVVGIAGFHWIAKKWRRRVKAPLSVWTRCSILALAACLYGSLWFSHVYFNLTITTKEGDKIKFREAAKHFWNSPAVQEFKKNLWKLLDHCREHGFRSAWTSFIESLDPLGEKNALRVLRLERDATQDEIKARYRELSKKWHPDKYKTGEEKSEAQTMFVEIQKSYEILSKMKSRRMRVNERTDSDDSENLRA